MALCGMIILLAFIEHSDMPKKIMGIQGLNPLNILLVVVLAGWATQRRGEGLTWDMPMSTHGLLVVYLLVFLVAIARLLVAPGSMQKEYTLTHLISERLINTIKWVIPGLLIYHGCRSRGRLKLVVVSVCLLYFLLACQVITYMPISSLWQPGDLAERMALAEEMGLPPSPLGKALAGGAWAMLAAGVLLKRKIFRVAILAAFVVISLAMGLAGSRSGYLAWSVVGFAMCLLRWKRYLLVLPVAAVILLFVFQGAAGRLTEGFGETDFAGQKTTNISAVTSGRNLIWPYVLDKIADSPVTGYGRDAMRRTGLTETIGTYVGQGEAVGHAHNAYLNLLLESGIVGLVVVLAFYGTVVYQSAQLFRSENSVCAVAGGVAFATVVGHLVAGIGSQHFWPQEADVGMWCAIGLVLRVARDRSVLAAAAQQARPIETAYLPSPSLQ